MRHIIYAVFLIVVSSSLYAGNRKGEDGFVACENQDQLLAMNQALTVEDSEAVSSLLSSGCYTINSDSDIELLEANSSGLAKINLIQEKGFVELWTYVKNVDVEEFTD